jgi:glycosyltransferase involved in cell wall biosynthesis
MRIAVTGIRGIPANYGGFETFVEELAPRLVQRGHEVTVYGRSNIIDYTGSCYKGARLVILPTISQKYLDTAVHTFISIIHSCFFKYDIVFLLNAVNSPFACIPRLTGKKVVLNVDGIERLRKKWSWIGKLFYRIGEYFATKFPNVIVSDAEIIRRYYLETYKKESVMIPYGANMERVNNSEILSKFNLQPKNYILYVSRLEPENNAHIVVEAFKKVQTEKNLVIVGDAPYATKYKQQLWRLAEDDERIIFTGYIFGLGYKELLSFAYAYVHASDVGGTPPALVNAMGFGNCVLVNGTESNKEVINDAGMIYRKNNIKDLKEKIEYVVKNPKVVSMYGEKAKERVKTNYSWDAVAEKYESVFLKLVR